MKHLATFLSAGIVAFWMAMNTRLVLQDLELRSLDRYQQGVNTFLGAALRRERWLGIYESQKKVGYSGYALEKVHALEGTEFHASVETLWRGSLPLPFELPESLRGSNQLEIHGEMTLDVEMRPLRMHIDLDLTLLEGTALRRTESFRLTGRRERSRFLVQVRCAAAQFEVPLALDRLVLSDGLAPAVPIAGCEVGDTYRVPVVDPLSNLTSLLGLGGQSATVTVVGKEVRPVGGVPADVFKLETKYRSVVTQSWVTASGEVVRQELGPPLGLVLKQEPSREQAVKGVREP